MLHIHYRLILAALLLPACLFAASETIRPSGTPNDISGWAVNTGDSNAIDEDTSSSDGTWVCVDSANCNVDTSNATSNQDVNGDFPFADPASSPTSTTDAQEVCVRMRKTTPSTHPSYTVDILEGNTVHVDNVINIAELSQIGAGVEVCANWTFDPGVWTDDTGAAIEVGIDCTHGGGTPSNRATCELGAIELNLTTQDSGKMFLLFTGMLRIFRGLF